MDYDTKKSKAYVLFASKNLFTTKEIHKKGGKGASIQNSVESIGRN
jgi:hypothetical protein